VLERMQVLASGSKPRAIRPLAADRTRPANSAQV
jgi:hypothetical protein